MEDERPRNNHRIELARSSPRPVVDEAAFVGHTEDGAPITVTIPGRHWVRLGRPDEIVLRVRPGR